MRVPATRFSPFQGEYSSLGELSPGVFWFQPRRVKQRFLLGLLAAAAFISAVPASCADSLEDVLAKLDRSAASFKSMSADLKQTAHTGAINEDQLETGAIRMRRAKVGDTRMLVNFAAPDLKTIELQGRTLDIYLPNARIVQEYDLGKGNSLIEQFLLLGFGTTRKDLLNANDVTFAGLETINGRPAVRLELTPKSKEVLQHIKKIDLWLSPETGYPIQHKIYQSGGDYQIFAFDNLKMNPPDVTEASLKLKVPKGVKTERPQH